MAYERVAGPLGGQRIDIGAAVVAATLANINRAKGSRSYDIDDFMPKWRVEESTEMSPDDVWAAVERAHRALTMRG